MASNNQNKNGSGWIQWVGIFIAFCISPPLGIVLFIVKLISDSNNKQKNKTRSEWEFTTSQTRESSFQNRTTTRTGTTAQYGSVYRSDKSDYQKQTNSYKEGWNPNRNTASRRAQASAGTAKGSRWDPVLLKKLTGAKNGRALKLWGWIILGLFSFVTLLTIMDSYYMLPYVLSDLMSSVFFAGIGGIMVHFGRRRAKKSRKYREYITIIGNQNVVNLRELARITGTEYETVCDDIADLISSGLFGTQAYIDVSEQCLILNEAGRRELQEKLDNRRADQEQRNAAEKAQRAAAEMSEEDRLLAEIRQVNDDIADEHLSAQIDRIEEITRLILQYRKEHPEKSSQLNSFLSYYLPTTLKILNSYAEAERQSYQGHNITETRKKVEGIMDKVVSGFEMQLDQLFADDRLDISTEIDVLENMMRQDGLIQDNSSDPFGDVLRGGTT